MAEIQFTGDCCPVHPDTPVFYTLGDGVRRFEERAGNLAWSIERVEEGRVVAYEPATSQETAA
jgi:hypothetical protein